VSRRRVVVTGLGIVSPVGNTVQEAWSNVLAGKSGVGRVTRFDASRIASKVAGEVKNFDVSQYLSPKRRAGWILFIHYGIAAGLQPWRDSGCRSLRKMRSRSASISAPASAGCR
jgi:3-oxoacyl-[acyl-carrier-protein] synthase II